MRNLIVPLLVGAFMASDPQGRPSVIRLELNERLEVEVAELVASLAKLTGIPLDRPKVAIRLPMNGLGGSLSKSLIAETIGRDVTIRVEGRVLLLEIPKPRLDASAKADWEQRLRILVERVEREGKRRADYGMGALKSYRPNDPARPTVCLIHGLNSTSAVFRHMIGPLEAAGYGVIIYDFPYNRDLDESAEAIRRDWVAFRDAWGDRRPWAVVAHSMGSLLARAYVEDDVAYRNDVVSLIFIAPVNRGSNLSKIQTLLQMRQGLKAVNNAAGTRGDALAHLGDGLGAAADDMVPGSAFLKSLNERKRRAGVAYHTIAGDVAFLTPATRRQIDEQLNRPALFGGLGRLAARTLSGSLDEVTEGTGDGCVSVASTTLDGVMDHVTLHANHLELIRAPLLFPDPGPVISMPIVLDRLAKDLPVPAKN